MKPVIVGVIILKILDLTYIMRLIISWNGLLQEESLRKENLVEYETATYDGTIIALMNRYTGSSAEMAVGYSKSIRKHLLIGENSHGAGIFGEQMQYVLPYSGIQLGMGCKLFLGDFSEGEGYQPDYWVDSSDVKGEVICWYKNQATYSPGWFSEP